MKKVLFWDFGDVLVFYDHMRSCRAFTAYTDKSAEEIYAIVFASQLEEQHYNRGAYTDEEWFALLSDRLALRDCDYDRFAEVWGDIFSPNPAIEPVLDAVDPEVRQYVLSNTNGLHFSWARRNIPVLQTHFSSPERSILSSDEMSRKPEPLIFERALMRAGVTAEEAFFVDDKIANVQAFRDLGGDGFVYSARETPVAELEAALKDAGLVQ